MSGGVDATRQARDHDESRVAEIAREPCGEFQPGGGGVARADDGDAGPQQHIDPAENGDQRRGGVDRLKRGRISALAEGEQTPAEPVQRRNLALGLGLRTDPDGPAGLAREIRQGLQRRRGAAIAVHQRAEGARADAFAADQPQPVETLAIVEDDPSHGRLSPSVRSCPRCRRAGGRCWRGA